MASQERRYIDILAGSASGPANMQKTRQILCPELALLPRNQPWFYVFENSSNHCLRALALVDNNNWKNPVLVKDATQTVGICYSSDDGIRKRIFCAIPSLDQLKDVELHAPPAALIEYMRLPSAVPSLLEAPVQSDDDAHFPETTWQKSGALDVTANLASVLHIPYYESSRAHDTPPMTVGRLIIKGTSELIDPVDLQDKSSSDLFLYSRGIRLKNGGFVMISKGDVFFLVPQKTEPSSGMQLMLRGRVPHGGADVLLEYTPPTGQPPSVLRLKLVHRKLFRAAGHNPPSSHLTPAATTANKRAACAMIIHPHSAKHGKSSTSSTPAQHHHHSSASAATASPRPTAAESLFQLANAAAMLETARVTSTNS